MSRKIFVTVATVLLLAFVEPGKAENWPQFRGWNGAGISEEKSLPIRWSDENHIYWKTDLPGPGHSSPCIWGDKIFLTAFRPEGGPPQISDEWVPEPKGELHALALSTRTGKILWQRKIPVKIEQVHVFNSPASPTPVTDGERVYFYFGSYGLLCYDLEGNKIWELPLGPSGNDHGGSSSPILYKDSLIMNSDNDEDPFLLAVHKKTGTLKWRTSRSGFERSFATPMLWKVNGKTELVVSGSYQVKGYDPDTGEEIWTCRGMTRWAVPIPVAAHGLLFATSGLGGNVFLAIRPGGRGDITNTHLAWRYNRGAPYVPSPVVVGEYLYAVRNGGVMICLRATTGQIAWQKRLPAGGDYYASILAADGKLYTLSEEGKACVLEAGPNFNLLSVNDMNERCMATPAISNGQIFIRSDQTLFCIGKPRSNFHTPTASKGRRCASPISRSSSGRLSCQPEILP